MTARDLNRADARKILFETRIAVETLNHLAIAGVLHADQANELTLARLTAMENAVHGLVDMLGDYALQLPEEET